MALVRECERKRPAVQDMSAERALVLVLGVIEVLCVDLLRPAEPFEGTLGIQVLHLEPGTPDPLGEYEQREAADETAISLALALGSRRTRWRCAAGDPGNIKPSIEEHEVRLLL